MEFGGISKEQAEAIKAASDRMFERIEFVNRPGSDHRVFVDGRLWTVPEFVSRYAEPAAKSERPSWLRRLMVRVLR